MCLMFLHRLALQGCQTCFEFSLKLKVFVIPSLENSRGHIVIVFSPILLRRKIRYEDSILFVLAFIIKQCAFAVGSLVQFTA